MSRNGAGSYSLPTPQNPVVTNTTVTSDWANTTLNDIASEITNSLPRDGQASMSANLPMGGFKLTNLANGVSSTDSVNYGQVFNSPVFVTPTAAASPAASDNSLLLATTAYVTQKAFAAALPAQSAATAGKFSQSGGASGVVTWAYAGIASINAGITTSTTLAGSYIYVPVNMSALGQSVTLPSALTLSTGGPQYIIDNTKGGYPCGIRDNTGALLMAVAAGGEAFVSLKDNTTQAGVWSVTGSNLEPGLITIDSTFSSTYASTVLAPFVALDNNTSIHFAALASGFAAFAVDNTGKVLTTPVTVSATASDVPCQAFKISTTQAICFYKNGTSASKAVVLTISGSSPSLSLAVGTVATAATATAWTAEDFVSAPKVAQLSSSTYVATNSDTTNTFATAISVSGSTVTIGTTVNIITSSSVAVSTTTYALTSTTALVLYLSGAGAPYAVNAVVASVSGATCTVNTPAAAASSMFSAAQPISCLLSPTKALIAVDNFTTTMVAHALTVTGAAVAWGAALTVESGVGGYPGAQATFTGSSATRYNPHLWAIGANTAGLWYLDSASISRAVVLTESSGTVTAGAILYRNISVSAANTAGNGVIAPQGASEFISLVARTTGVGYSTALSASRVTGTSITVGSAKSLGDSLAGAIASMFVTRLSTGKYAVTCFDTFSATGIPVFSSNGDAISFFGTISIPNISFTSGVPCAVSSSRLVMMGATQKGTTVGASTYQLRLLNIEIAQ